MLDAKLLNSILHVTQQKLSGRVFKREFRERGPRSDTHAPIAPDYTIRNEGSFQFTWYHNEISYQNENFIRSQNRNQVNPEQIQWNL